MKKRTRAVRRAGGTKPARAARRERPAAEPPGLLRLQGTAGNAAVSSLVQRQDEHSSTAVAETREESSAVYDKATAAFEAGEYAEAERLFGRLLAGGYRQREAITTLVWNLAMCRAHLGDFDGAFALGITYGHYGGGRADEQKLLERIEHVRQADATGGTGVGPPQTEAAAHDVYEQATAAFADGDWGRATDLFETLLASPVKHDEALPTIVWNLAMCKAHLGDFDRAYALALQYGRFPAGGDERQLLGRIDGLRQGLAGEDGATGLPKTREEASALYEQASASFESGRYDEAKRLYERLLASPVDHAGALPSIVWSLAMCRARLGDFGGARQLALTYTQYRGTEDDERKLFVQIARLEQGADAAPATP